MNLKDLLKQILKEDKMLPVACRVLSVQGNTALLEPLNGSVQFSARLKASDVPGIHIIPEDDSIVIAEFAENGNIPYISTYSSVKSIDLEVTDKIKIANSSQNLGKLLVDLCAAIETLTVTTPMGPSGTPINIAQFASIKTNLQTLLKTN